MSIIRNLKFRALDVKLWAKNIGYSIEDKYEYWREAIDDAGNDIRLAGKDLYDSISLDLWVRTHSTPIVGKAVRKGTRLLDNAKSVVTTALNPFTAYSVVYVGGARQLKKSELNKGDHVYVLRPGYTHHGIYIGDGKVIHFAPKSSSVNEFTNAIIHETTLEGFKKFASIRDKMTGEVYVFKMSKTQSPVKYTSDEIVARAKTRIGQRDYNLITNNCEHFARWCRCDDKY